MLKTRTKRDQLVGKREKIEKELTGVQEKINAARRELGEAVLGDGDGTSAKITVLETALSKLEDRERGLKAALEVGQVEIDESQDQADQESYQADLAECKRIDKHLNAAAMAYIRDFYKKRDDLIELVDLHNRAKMLSRKHNDEFDTIGITKSGQVIGSVHRTVVPLSRSIEIFAADLVKDAGEKRRF